MHKAWVKPQIRTVKEAELEEEAERSKEPKHEKKKK